MVTIDGEEVPQHISYSSLTDYLNCGWLYYLSRVKQLKETPAWWLYGGVAVHQATEDWYKDEWNINGR